MVAAVQQIDLTAHRHVVGALMDELNRRILRTLRSVVGTNRRDRGWKIIEEVHGQLIEAVLDPTSADGAGMREAFFARLKFRAHDEIRREMREDKRRDDAAGGDEGVLSRCAVPAVQEGEAYVESVLRKMKDPRKALAIRLYMDGAQRGGTNGHSIARALGVSTKTAETWVKEAKEELKTILGAEL
ncbi:hypothetical protein [Brevundimonas subvibrioides]|uniref:hypothetical protein n=1 Tax=Brevundimonas subvibrioides TaxID=74313 RepID=UPI0022B3ABF7|nr:hypothetical protein [Brevundimonas subvibrioides]